MGNDGPLSEFGVARSVAGEAQLLKCPIRPAEWSPWVGSEVLAGHQDYRGNASDWSIGPLQMDRPSNGARKPDATINYSNAAFQHSANVKFAARAERPGGASGSPAASSLPAKHSAAFAATLFSGRF